MDWVSNGDKFQVEFNFGMIDTDSIMARVENSKESMRNATIIDTDGANEVQGVTLTPKTLGQALPAETARLLQAQRTVLLGTA